MHEVGHMCPLLSARAVNSTGVDGLVCSQCMKASRSCMLHRPVLRTLVWFYIRGLLLSYTSKEKICGGESGIFPLSGEIPPPRGSLSLRGQGPPVHCIGGWGVYRNIIRQEVDSVPKGSPIPMEFRFKPNVGLKSAFHWSESSAMHAWLSSNTQNQFD